jgi:tetratricopeptide (TPR) repeat protein/transcriptional regulator with XRE-family HTH domain
MRTFSELISHYIQRSGVSDAELARRLGVSRQTIFRWREGHTSRPRHRQDVIDLASKLRLTGDERDELLLAAGFPPQTMPADAQSQDTTPDTGLDAPASRQVPPVSFKRWAWYIIPVLAVMLGVFLALNFGDILPSIEPGRNPRRAVAGETLVLISEFTNFAREQGYNVAGRLGDSLEDAFSDAGIANVRVEEVPAVEDEESALNWLHKLDASLIIWGEYDSGQVLAIITTQAENPSDLRQERRWLVAGGEQLSSTINFDLPNEISWISLYVLGRERYADGDFEGARSALLSASLQPPTSEENLAPVYFYLGLIEQASIDGNVDRAVGYYSQALSIRPTFTAARNNRAMAYLQRNSAGDLNRAAQDLAYSIEQQSDFPEAYYNLALVRIWQDPANLRASIELLEQALELAPDSAFIENGLCWYMSLAGEAPVAMPHCDHAISLGSVQGYDSRGVAHAMLGEFRAAASDFSRFLDRLENEDPARYERFAESRLQWLDELAAGQNPFTAALIDQLLRE